MDNAAGHKRHFLLSRTADDLPFPVQGKRLLVKVFPFANWPSFAIDVEVVTAFSHEMATHIAPVDVEFCETYSLRLQVSVDLFRHAGFRHIRRRDTSCPDQPCIQIVEDMPSVTIHTHAPAFSSVPHVGVFVTFASIFGDPFDQVRLPLLSICDILRLHMLSNLQGWLHHLHFFRRKCLYPGCHRLQILQNEPERFFSLSRLIPVSIERGFQASSALQRCSGFLPDLCQFLSLLLGHRANDRISARAHSNCRYPRLGQFPRAGCYPTLRVKCVVLPPGSGWQPRWSVR